VCPPRRWRVDDAVRWRRRFVTGIDPRRLVEKRTVLRHSPVGGQPSAGPYPVSRSAAVSTARWMSQAIDHPRRSLPRRPLSQVDVLGGPHTRRPDEELGVGRLEPAAARRSV